MRSRMSSARYEKEIDDFRKMYRFRVRPDRMDARYLEAFLQTDTAQTLINKMKTGISDSGLESYSMIDSGGFPSEPPRWMNNTRSSPRSRSNSPGWKRESRDCGACRPTSNAMLLRGARERPSGRAGRVGTTGGTSTVGLRGRGDRAVHAIEGAAAPTAADGPVPGAPVVAEPATAVVDTTSPARAARRHPAAAPMPARTIPMERRFRRSRRPTSGDPGSDRWRSGRRRSHRRHRRANDRARRGWGPGDRWGGPPWPPARGFR